MKAADQVLLRAIEVIKADHLFWGYRRVWSYLCYRQHRIEGKNSVYRVMKENDLLVTKQMKLKAKRTSGRPKPRASRFNQYWGMDMRKILFPDGWGYLHIVKDWYNKEIVGWHFSKMSRTDDWLEALNSAINKRFPSGIRRAIALPELVSDNGCQPTSERFMKACSGLGVRQIFTSFNNPKGNADTERVIRTIREDLVWIYDWASSFEFERAFSDWVEAYNTDFPHMTL